MARSIISKEKFCSVLSFVIFTGLFICAILFSLGPIEQFLSQKSSFSQYTAPIEERPTIIICLKNEILPDQKDDDKDKKKDLTMCECEIMEKKVKEKNSKKDKNEEKNNKDKDEDKKTFECDCSSKGKKTEDVEEESKTQEYW